MNFPKLKISLLFSIVLLMSLACQNATEPSSDQGAKNDTLSVKEEPRGLKIAYIYGDTINAKYQFLIDAENELETERKKIDERLRRKLQRAEKRATELQQQAPTMTQTQMQEAQLEMQNLEIDMQRFQETLANDFREKEIALQTEYVAKVDSFLNAFNADGRYDMILNFQAGGNLLWINSAYDVTDEVLEGLNSEYKAESKAETSK
jgi:outer membrane protein